MSGPAVRRVLMTADAVGGVWTYALELAAGLDRAGVAVDLAVMGPPPDRAQRAAAARIPGLTLDAAPYKLEWMEGAADDVVRAGDWLLELESRRAPELVHLNGYAHGALPFAAPKLVAAHSSVGSWWQAVHGCPPPASWDGYTRAVARGLAGADYVIAPSMTMLRTLDRDYGRFEARRAVVPNGLPPAPLPTMPKREVILSAGRMWDAAKNVGALVAAAPSLPWPVWLAGDASLSADDRTPLPEVANGVRYLGRLSSTALATAYEQASIYALPARYEPFGLTVLEAAQRGCALVLGDIDSLRENWDGAALFVPPEDAAALVSALRTFIADDSTRRGWAAAARRRAARFTSASMCTATLDVYTGLVAASPRTRSQRAARHESGEEADTECVS